MAGFIDLVTPKAEGAIDLTQSGKTPPLVEDKELVSASAKVDYALNELSPGFSQVYGTFALNQQAQLEELARAGEAMKIQGELRDEARRVIDNAVGEGRSLTDEESHYIATLQGREPPKKEVALEKRFADRVSEETFSEEFAILDSFLQDSAPVKEEVSSHLTQQQITLKVAQEYKRKYDESSWGSFAADLGKTMIPGYNWVKMRDRIDTGQDFSLWTGTNIEQQIRALHLIRNPDEYETALREIVDPLFEDNHLLGLAFAQYALEYSSSDAATENFFTALDLVDFAPLVGIATAGAVGVGRTALRSKLKSVSEELANPNLTKTDIDVLKGETQVAAESSVADNLAGAGVLEGTRPERMTNDLSSSSFGLFDHESYLRSAGSLTKENQRRIRDSLERNKRTLLATIEPNNGTHVVRMNGEATQRGFELARKEQERLYPHLEDHVVEVKYNTEAENVFGGVDNIEVLYGTKGGNAFTSAEAAANYAEKFLRVSPENFTPYQKGNSWYLRVERNVDETSDDLTSLRLSTDHQTPVDWSSRFLSLIRMPESSRSKAATEWAKVSTLGGQAVAERMVEASRPIASLGKNAHRRLSEVMADAQFKNRVVKDPTTGEDVTVQGVFYKNQAELDTAYLQKGFNHPTVQESEAYWTFRNLMDFDLLQRNVSMWRDKARQGMAQHEVSWTRVVDGKKEKVSVPPFEGRVRESIPEGTFTIAWTNEKTGKTGFKLSSQDGWYTKVNELLDDGYKLIEVFDNNSKTIKDLVNSKGDPVDYIVVKTWKEKPLSFRQVPANEGGHWMYPQSGKYVKQARTHKTGTGRVIYDGDFTVHWQNRSVDADELSRNYETARMMFLRDDPAFDTFVPQNLPYSSAALRAKFTSKEFDPASPFVSVTSGQKVSDVTAMDGVVPAGSALSGRVFGSFTQERGGRLTTVTQGGVGSEASPAFNLRGAPILDPLQALTRGMSDLTRSRYYEDYVHQTAEDFITQFARVFDTPSDVLKRNPREAITNPRWKENADPRELAAAKAARRNLMYLLGKDSSDFGMIASARQKIIDSVLKPYGKDSKILSPWQWSNDTDPAVIARSAVFDMYLGFFNPLQFFLQGQGALYVAAIDGNARRAFQGTYLYTMARTRGLTQGNTKAQSFLSKATAKSLGLTQDVVDEAYDLFLRTGTGTFGGAYSRLDDYINPKLFGPRGKVGRFLDAGRVFFKEGNLLHQGQAFMTAYLRWKDMNPLRKPTQRDIAQIMERSSLYYNDMTRASNNAVLSSSLASVPLQFSQFHRNLAENLLGHRLTVGEKTRVMAMYSVLYGLPTGNPFSLWTAPLWPMADSIRQYALEQGLDQSDPYVNLAMNGVVQASLDLMTGENYDTERYSPGGLDWMKEMLSGNFGEVIQGPSGVGILRSIETMAPFARAFMSVFTDETDDYYSLTSSDWIDAARNISSVNNLVKAYYVFKTGEFMTKSDSLQYTIQDPDLFDAALVGILGLSPQEVADAYLMIDSNQKEKESQQALVQEAMKLFKRGMKASAAGNHEEGMTFMKNAKVVLQTAGLNPLEMSQVQWRALTENESLFEEISREFSLRDVDRRLDTYRKQTRERMGIE